MRSNQNSKEIKKATPRRTSASTLSSTRHERHEVYFMEAEAKSVASQIKPVGEIESRSLAQELIVQTRAFFF